ncbi:MAG: hypothetical protein FWF05_02850 [Oscillospiraceae bacterium]|nr:hypothetical protein [Oscillospiraceae bacterium]
MGKLKYIASRAREMDFGNILHLAQKVSDRSGKNKYLVMLDMGWCGLRYQAGYTDYELFAMERANSKQRKTYVTRGINDKLVARFNDKDLRHIFVNKDEFNDMFSSFLHRNWLKIYPKSADADFDAECGKLADFCAQQTKAGKTEIVAKPRDGMCGKGVEMIRPADYPDSRALYRYLQSMGTGLVEELIVQHPEMNRLYPNSINTLRMVTINNGGKISLVIALCRMGNGGRVDNFLNGGLMTRVCLETGKLLYDAVNAENVVFERHPVTGTVFRGFQLPMWERCAESAKAAAAVLPEVGYVGWDFAVTPGGPVLVEGNEFPGHCLYQLPPHTPDNFGVMPLFEQAML